MTLSKLRRCKYLLFVIGRELDLELSTIALSWVYLEKLTCKNLVEKKNRKLVTAICITLAHKYNEGIQTQTHPKKGIGGIGGGGEGGGIGIGRGRGIRGQQGGQNNTSPNKSQQPKALQRLFQVRYS